MPDTSGLPLGWSTGGADAASARDVDELTALLRDREADGAGASADDVLVELADRAGTRRNVVLRDPDGTARAWGSVHDRAGGRMLFVHVVGRSVPEPTATACSTLLFDWAEEQAREVGAARGLAVQQIDTGAFADDSRQHDWLAAAGYERVRTWWQMSRPVTPDEATLVPSPERWESGGVVFRLVEREGSGMPDEDDLRALHDVLEGAFTDHFNSHEESFDEFVDRLREDPGHRWDHWWLAEIVDGDEVEAAGALVGTVLEGDGPDGSYVAYIGVLESARGRGMAKGLLNTIIADSAARGRDRIKLEVDADSTTGAESLYLGMGWTTAYITESWHKDIPVGWSSSER
jgi:ribosomal protein S18 acetylase RimI-like enzyme